MICAFVGVRNRYLKPDSGINVGRIAEQFCHEEEIALSHDLECRIQRDKATISKMLHGLAPFDLNAWACLPSDVLLRFFHKVMHAKLAAEARAMADLQKERKLA